MSFVATTTLGLSRYRWQYEVANVACCGKDGILNNLIFAGDSVVHEQIDGTTQAREGRGVASTAV